MPRMVRVFWAVLLSFPLMMAALSLRANPTLTDARALVLKAADDLSAKGLQGACSDFSQKPGPYWVGEVYVFVLSQDGIWECYPPKPSAAGLSLLSLTDVDGKAFVREMISVAKAHGEGVVDYKWKNPVNGLIQLKTSFVKMVNGHIVAAGVFK